MDTEMMAVFLKLKEKVGKNLSNKEALRRMLKRLSGVATRNVDGRATAAKNRKPQPQAKNLKEIPGERENERYIPVAQKREVLAKTNGICSHENCCNPAQIFHHQIRFSQTKNHTSIISLCKIHHEFAHNGITEPLTKADELYRKYRQATLI